MLAREVIARAENDLDLRWLVERLAASYPQCWTYLVDGLVGASPEMLVKREAGLAVSRVLAGTIQRSGDDDHDLNLAAALASRARTCRSTSTPSPPWPAPCRRRARG